MESTNGHTKAVRLSGFGQAIATGNPEMPHLVMVQLMQHQPDQAEIGHLFCHCAFIAGEIRIGQCPFQELQGRVDQAAVSEPDRE